MGWPRKGGAAARRLTPPQRTQPRSLSVDQPGSGAGGGLECISSSGHRLSGPISIRTDQDRFLLSNSDLRFANGEWVAPPRPAPAASVLPPPVASNCRWCSLSWQYRHNNSQLLPSGGLL